LFTPDIEARAVFTWLNTFCEAARVSTLALFDVLEATPPAAGNEVFASAEDRALPVALDGTEFVEDALAPTAAVLCGVYIVAPFTRDDSVAVLGVEVPFDPEWGV